MSKIFTLASWNVEHFKDDANRVKRIVEFLKKQNPDVFGLFEVEGKTVFNQLVNKMPEYQFHITEGNQVQEILVGVHSHFTAFFTQRTEFKSGNTYLRPGALLTLHIEGENYTILFLHTKMGSKPVGLGIRDDMFERAFKFKKTLDAKASEKIVHYLFLGDLNTMGMRYPFSLSINPKLEVQKIEQLAGKKGTDMRLLKKNRPYTWWNGSGSKMKPSDLDQVVASRNLKFLKFDGGDVDVRGWAEYENDADKTKWIKSYSDHSLIYLEVIK